MGWFRVYQWIGWRENLQENLIFNGKNMKNLWFLVQIFAWTNPLSLGLWTKASFFVDTTYHAVYLLGWGLGLWLPSHGFNRYMRLGLIGSNEPWLKGKWGLVRIKSLCRKDSEPKEPLFAVGIVTSHGLKHFLSWFAKQNKIPLGLFAIELRQAPAVIWGPTCYHLSPSQRSFNILSRTACFIWEPGMLYITILSLLAPLASAGVKGFGIIFSVWEPRKAADLNLMCCC